MKKFLITEEDKKHILSLYNINESLPPSRFRKYVKEFNRERYSDIFKTLGDKYDHDKNYYRIYIPLVKSETKGPISNTQKEVTDFLTKNGYQVLDYIKGIVKFGDSKNTTTVGKALTRMKADDLMKKFVSDESRKALTSDSDSLEVVISRHPYDIAGSDTDRNWTNCMTMGHETSQRVQKLRDEYNELRKKYQYTSPDELRKINQDKISRGEDIDFDEEARKFKESEDLLAKVPKEVLKKIESLKKEIEDRKEMGQNVKYIINDIKEGSLVSYLIKKSDRDIKNPISVLNIKPYSNEKDKNDIILISDGQMYGQGRPEFKKTVDNILDEINGKGKEGFYCLNKKLYADSPERVAVFNEDYFSKIVDVVKKYFIDNISKVSNDLFNFELGQMEDYFSSELSEILDDEDDDFEEKIDKYMTTFQSKVDVKEKEMVEGFKNCFLNEINNHNFFSRDFIYNQIKNFTGKKIVIDDVIDTLYDSIFYELCDSDCYMEYYKDPMGYIQSEILNEIEGI